MPRGTTEKYNPNLHNHPQVLPGPTLGANQTGRNRRSLRVTSLGELPSLALALAVHEVGLWLCPGLGRGQDAHILSEPHGTRATGPAVMGVVRAGAACHLGSQDHILLFQVLELLLQGVQVEVILHRGGGLIPLEPGEGIASSSHASGSPGRPWGGTVGQLPPAGTQKGCIPPSGNHGSHNPQHKGRIGSIFRPHVSGKAAGFPNTCSVPPRGKATACTSHMGKPTAWSAGGHQHAPPRGLPARSPPAPGVPPGTYGVEHTDSGSLSSAALV